MIWKDIMLTSYEQPLMSVLYVARIERNVLLMNVAV